MNRILSLVRRCVEDYDMIQAWRPGGGGGLRRQGLPYPAGGPGQAAGVLPQPLHSGGLHPGHGGVQTGRPGMDFSPDCPALCREMEVPYTILGSEIQHIIFDVRKEKNPCSMCAKMRRGALHSALLERGITQDRTGPPLR